MKLLRHALPLAFALPLFFQFPADGADKKKEEGITRQQADQILDELRQIHQLLEQQQAKAGQKDEGPKRAKLSLQGAQLMGNKDAPVTIVEFTDYQCPFCQRFHTDTFASLKKDFIDTGKVRFYSRDLPLDFHANAMRAAQAGRCAGEQSQFWQMRELMSASPDELEMANLLVEAGSLRLNVNAFRDCVESGKFKNAVETDVLEAMKIGADGTPAFVIGKSTADGVDGELVVGAQPYVLFEQKLKEAAGK